MMTCRRLRVLFPNRVVTCPARKFCSHPRTQTSNWFSPQLVGYFLLLDHKGAVMCPLQIVAREETMLGNSVGKVILRNTVQIDKRKDLVQKKQVFELLNKVSVNVPKSGKLSWKMFCVCFMPLMSGLILFSTRAQSLQLTIKPLSICLSAKDRPIYEPSPLGDPSKSSCSSSPLKPLPVFSLFDHQPPALPDALLSGFLSPSIPWHSPRWGAAVMIGRGGRCGCPEGMRKFSVNI